MATKSVLTGVVLMSLVAVAPAEPIPIGVPGDIIIYERSADPANVYPNAAWRNYRPRFYRPEFYEPAYNGRAFPRYPYYIRRIGPIPRQIPPGTVPQY